MALATTEPLTKTRQEDVMDLVITLIGNAAVHPKFREIFLRDPIGTADKYGFRLTKGDFEIMTTVFANLKEEERERMERAFRDLEEELYNKLRPACMKPCKWSLEPPPGLREKMTEGDEEIAKQADKRLRAAS
jgi:hypothetical protein